MSDLSYPNDPPPRPSAADMAAAAARLDAATAALRTAVERHETMLTFAALLLKVAAPLAASVPGAPTAVEVAKLALDMASRRA